MIFFDPVALQATSRYNHPLARRLSPSVDIGTCGLGGVKKKEHQTGSRSRWLRVDAGSRRAFGPKAPHEV